MKMVIQESHHDDDCKQVSKMKDTYGETLVNSGSDVNNGQFEVGKPYDSAGAPTREPKRGIVCDVLRGLFLMAIQSLIRILWKRLVNIILCWSGINPVCMPVVDCSSRQAVNSVYTGAVNSVCGPVVYYPSMPVVNSGYIGAVNPVRIPVVYSPSIQVVNLGYIGVVNPVRIPVVYYPSIQVVNSGYIGAVNPVCMPEVKVWYGDSFARTFVWGLWKFNTSPGTVE